MPPQVTFLHLFHHASITVIVGSLLPFGAWRLFLSRKQDLDSGGLAPNAILRNLRISC
jgi:hypothetical protein